MATIQKRKNKHGLTYQATVRLKGYKPESRTFDTKGEAAGWAASIEQEMRARTRKDPRLAQAITFGKAMERYIRDISSQKKPVTQAREKGCSARLLERIGSMTTMADVTPDTVARYRDARLKTVSAYSVRLELALLSHLFSKASREWGIPVENPVDMIDRPAAPKGRTKFLTYPEAEKLLTECKKRRNKKLYYFVFTIIHTGMRPSEAATLRWEQVDLNRRMISLPTSKNDEPRTIPMTMALVSALSDLRDEDDLLFLREEQLQRGQGITTPASCFRESFNKSREKAGLPWIRMHDLRHTAASHLIMAGVDIRTLAEILGHKTLQMVQRYTHLLHDHKLTAIDKIGALGQKK